MVQTTYSTMLSNPRPGVPADLSDFKDYISGIASALLPFGVLAVEDLTAPGKFKLPTSAADLLKNPAVVVATHAVESRRDSAPASYAAGDLANLMKVGRIWVFPEQNVVDGDPVYVRGIANGGLTQLGAFRKDADSANAFLLAGAKWRDTVTTGAGVVARIEIMQAGV